MPEALPILVLAAGASSRMGKIKQLLPYQGTTLLGHALQQAINSKLGNVYCVLGAHATQIKVSILGFDIRLVENPNWEAGLSTSLAAGVQAVLREQPLTKSILIMLADQPFVMVGYLQELHDLSILNPNKIIASSYKDGLGVPIVLPDLFFTIIMDSKGDVGAKKIINQNKNDVISVEAAHLLKDVDTPEDYDSLVRVG